MTHGVETTSIKPTETGAIEGHGCLEGWGGHKVEGHGIYAINGGIEGFGGTI